MLSIIQSTLKLRNFRFSLFHKRIHLHKRIKEKRVTANWDKDRTV